LKEINLKRTYFKDATIGHLFLSGKDFPLWHTIELPNLNNEPKISCIPEGSYTVKAYTSPKFPDVWELQGVPNRSKILVHTGNSTDDIKGCILVGLQLTTQYKSGLKKKWLLSSRLALNEIKHELGYPSDFIINITS
jgi:hypothetical protein